MVVLFLLFEIQDTNHEKITKGAENSKIEF